MKKLGWAIVWPGPIAHKFAKVVPGIDAVLNNTGVYAIYHLHRDTTRRSR